MFTGLIEEVGIVEELVLGNISYKLKIRANIVLENIKLGDSIATNGICLTVVEFSENSFTVDVMAETIKKTNFNSLKNGSRVNLERALKLGDRLGGHIVTGHIDGVGKINFFSKEGIATIVNITIDKSLEKYIVEKGSIAIDGTSLTIFDVKQNSFSVSLVPITKENTILLKKNIGDIVNIECDIIGKYTERLFSVGNRKEDISENFLKENGFY